SYAAGGRKIPPRGGSLTALRRRPTLLPMAQVSVVIPTFERMDVLPEVLTALERQEAAPPFEVVVVDDGSRDGTPAFLGAYRGPLALRVLRQENRGPATARNAGVAA